MAAGLPNTGQYFWEYDPRSPRQIYLRLEVRDDAGNIAIDQLTEPIKVEGLEPKGQIRGFKAGPENNRGGSRCRSTALIRNCGSVNCALQSLARPGYNACSRFSFGRQSRASPCSESRSATCCG